MSNVEASEDWAYFNRYILPRLNNLNDNLGNLVQAQKESFENTLRQMQDICRAMSHDGQRYKARIRGVKPISDFIRNGMEIQEDMKGALQLLNASPDTIRGTDRVFSRIRENTQRISRWISVAYDNPESEERPVAALQSEAKALSYELERNAFVTARAGLEMPKSAGQHGLLYRIAHLGLGGARQR
jgi:hypothetical protein